jgi:SAM-dependent methyltransferase
MAISSRDRGYDNLAHIDAGRSVDPINAQFYGRFQYPWPPLVIQRVTDPGFESQFLSQGVGEWTGNVLPAKPRIWVAGCGTNQAVLTAVSFPAAQVVGSDLSTESLAASRRLAEQLNVTNLELRNESINAAGYSNEFDYVVCTGVIHHNEHPQQTLAQLASALKPDGLLQLMVYNRYHCVEAVAVQNAVTLLAAAGDGDSGLDNQLKIASEIIEERDDLKQRVLEFFPGMEYSEAAVADAFIQPVTHTFTVLEVHEMAAACGLDLVLPCVNQLDVTRNCFDWDMETAGSTLRAAYEALSDVLRWQVVNLLKQGDSPMLWFYLRPEAARWPKRSEHEIVSQFCDQLFEVAETTSQTFFRTQDGAYKPAERLGRYPGRHRYEECQRIIDVVAERKRARIRDVLSELAMPADFTALNRLRARLATSSFPYLRAC